MSLPTPYTLRVRRWVTGDPDEFGNAARAATEHDWPVHALAPGALPDEAQANRDLSVVTWTVLAPMSDLAPSEYDEVRLPGDSEWYAVNGRPQDWTHGPWPHPTAGVVVELRRADG